MVGRLEATLETQRRFLADASHELRSPLTALGGGVDVLLLGADHNDPAARDRLLRLMDGEVGRMGRLVDDLLALTRFDTQARDALRCVPVDLVALIDEVAETARLLAPDLTVTVALDRAGPAAVVVPGDPDRLRQALLNLCANARTHTPPGGTITLGLRRLGTKAVVTVADTGAGIAPADLPRVWDRFYRADPARARQAEQGGLGLGLPIVRAIVEAHGGSATIASTRRAGTTVTLTLPIEAPASTARRTAAATAPPSRTPDPTTA
jgi:two-component system OmpR family sensor kinase